MQDEVFYFITHPYYHLPWYIIRVSRTYCNITIQHVCKLNRNTSTTIQRYSSSSNILSDIKRYNNVYRQIIKRRNVRFNK